MLSIEKSRSILGKSGKQMTNDQILELSALLRLCAKLFIRDFTHISGGFIANIKVFIDTDVDFSNIDSIIIRSKNKLQISSIVSTAFERTYYGIS